MKDINTIICHTICRNTGSYFVIKYIIYFILYYLFIYQNLLMTKIQIVLNKQLIMSKF